MTEAVLHLRCVMPIFLIEWRDVQEAIESKPGSKFINILAQTTNAAVCIRARSKALTPLVGCTM